MAFPLFYPQLQPGSGLSFPWSFMTRHGHEASWGSNGQRVVERMIIRWGDYADCTAQSELCGYSYIQPPAGLGFGRVLPWAHPQFPQLYVDEEAGITSVTPAGKPFKVEGARGPYVQYPYAILTLVFTERRYSVTGGYPIANDWPFLEFVDRGSAEYIQLNTGSYQYDPTDPTVVAAGLINKAAEFKTGIALLDAKDMITVKWHLVPHRWLHNAMGLASNILRGLSTVNADFFLGFEPGVLYFDSHDKEQKSLPISVQPGGQVPTGNIQDTWAWNVTMIFKYRRPPTAPGAVVQGHQLAPAPQASITATGGGPAWFPVRAVPVAGAPAANGARLYSTSDFGDLFLKAT